MTSWKIAVTVLNFTSWLFGSRVLQYVCACYPSDSRTLLGHTEDGNRQFLEMTFFNTARILETDSLDFKFYMSCGSWALSFDIQKGI